MIVIYLCFPHSQLVFSFEIWKKKKLCIILKSQIKLKFYALYYSSSLVTSSIFFFVNRYCYSNLLFNFSFIVFFVISTLIVIGLSHSDAIKLFVIYDFLFFFNWQNILSTKWQGGIAIFHLQSNQYICHYFLLFSHYLLRRNLKIFITIISSKFYVNNI